jgi:hypothetical protein
LKIGNYIGLCQCKARLDLYPLKFLSDLVSQGSETLDASGSCHLQVVSASGTVRRSKCLGFALGFANTAPSHASFSSIQLFSTMQTYDAREAGVVPILFRASNHAYAMLDNLPR